MIGLRTGLYALFFLDLCGAYLAYFSLISSFVFSSVQKSKLWDRAVSCFSHLSAFASLQVRKISKLFGCKSI